MRNIWSTFRFELKNQIKKKSFWVSNAIMIILILALTSLPTIIGFFTEDGPSEEAGAHYEDNEQVPDQTAPEGTGPSGKLGKFVADDSIDLEVLSQVYPFSEMIQVSSEEELRSELMNGQAPVGILFEDGQMRVLVKSENMNTDARSYGEGFAIYQNQKILADEGVDAATYEKAIINPSYPIIESLEKSSLQNFIIAYVGVFAIYLLIMLYGQSTATMIATEKSNRTMEILITSTKPKTLVVGKVLAGLVTALIQILILTASVVIGITINKGSYPAGILQMVQENITLELFLVFTIFTIAGFALYLFIYATSGALVSKIEDINKALVPITMITMFAFFISFFSLYGTSDSNLLKITSFIPFTSPYAMFIRYSAFGVSFGELALSLAILVATTMLVAMICIKIYRSATLNYGKSVSFFKEARNAFKKD